MRRYLFVSLLALTGFTILAIALAVLPGSAKADPPGKVETGVMTFAKHQILIGNRQQKNPLQDNAQTLSDGKEAFGHFCAACHGLDGQNTGVPFAARMSPPVPLLTSPEIQAYSDGQLKWILDYGIWPSGMPGSKGTLSDEELWSIVVYIRHLPAAGSVGEPEMYTH